MPISLCKCQEGCDHCIESVLYSAARSLLTHANLSGMNRTAEIQVADFLFIRLRKSADYMRFEAPLLRAALREYVADIASGKAEEPLSHYLMEMVPPRADPRVHVPHLSALAVQLMYEHNTQSTPLA